MNLMRQAKYLKHIGKLNDTKVTIDVMNNYMVIHIQDREFYSFDSALKFLQEDARNIVRMEIAA